MIELLLSLACSRPDPGVDAHGAPPPDDTGLPCIDDPPRWVNECTETSPSEYTVDGCMKSRPDEGWPPGCTLSEPLATKCEALVGRDGCECFTSFVRNAIDRNLGGVAQRCMASDGVDLDVYFWGEDLGGDCDGLPTFYAFSARFTATDGHLVEIQQEIGPSNCSGGWCCGEGGVMAGYLSWGVYHRLESCEFPMDLVALLAEDTGCP